MPAQYFRDWLTHAVIRDWCIVKDIVCVGCINEFVNIIKTYKPTDNLQPTLENYIMSKLNLLKINSSYQLDKELQLTNCNWICGYRH